MFRNLKKAFGFDPDDDDDPVIQDDPDSLAPSLPESPLSAADNGPDEIKVDIDNIFTHVVEVFNAALPDFLSKTANPQAQRKYLFDTLDNDVKAYLADIERKAQALCESRWNDDKSNLNAEVRKLEARAKEIEEKRLELSQRQLSADRQKRALSDRVHDLEKQVSKLDADREQLDLENKSLLNKLKVATVFEKENDELRNELNRLQGEILHMRSHRDEAPDTTNDDMAAELESTKHSLADTSSKLEQLLDSHTALKRDNADLATRIDSLTQQNQQLEQSCRQLERQLTESKQLAERLQLKQNEAKDPAQTQQIKEQAETIKRQAHTISEQEAMIQQLGDSRREAEEVAAQLGAIEEQIARFRVIKEEKDATIARLKNELKQAKEQLAQSHDNNDTIAAKPTRTYNRSGEQDNRRRQDRRRQDKQATRASRPETPIEDILSDTDWLVSPSDKQTKNNDRRDNHRQRPDNDSQLSLF